MAQFNEVGRVQVGPSREVVLSEVSENDRVLGFHINSHVKTQKYTGFTKGGIFIPKHRLGEFSDLVKQALLNGST